MSSYINLSFFRQSPYRQYILHKYIILVSKLRKQADSLCVMICWWRCQRTKEGRRFLNSINSCTNQVFFTPKAGAHELADPLQLIPVVTGTVWNVDVSVQVAVFLRLHNKHSRQLISLDMPENIGYCLWTRNSGFELIYLVCAFNENLFNSKREKKGLINSLVSLIWNIFLRPFLSFNSKTSKSNAFDYNDILPQHKKKTNFTMLLRQ